MKTSFYLNVYAHDPDSPAGIVLLEIQNLDALKFPLIDEVHRALDQSGQDPAQSYYYDRSIQNPQFGDQLVAEISAASQQFKILAHGSWWQRFLEGKLDAGWVVLQVSYDAKSLFNDSFWDLGD